MPGADLSIINWLLSPMKPDLEPERPDFNKWRDIFYANALGWNNSAARAIAGGFMSPCPAFAFVAGYVSALHCLLPDLLPHLIPSFCITEKGGGHPRAIAATLSPGPDAPPSSPSLLLNGKKTFITCACEADIFLVAASTGISGDGKNIIRLARVASTQPGIRITPLTGLNILPEISHARVEFKDVVVRAEDLMAGDGYIRYIKPFRTIEDIHVIAGILGYLFRCGRLYGWDRKVMARILGLMPDTIVLARNDPLSPAVHILTSDLLARILAMVEDLKPLWAKVGGNAMEEWNRDRALLGVAGKARAMRLKSAWKAIESMAEKPFPA
ncbi:MAG: acyl-CoA dehydrogenase [Deltaproteobacteria bacterium]|nr:acyl-CoA dehydrogenase [Deltaproteobacteria bacterium]